MEGSYPKGEETMWEKEKLLVTSNFSFSHSVFKRLVSQGRQKVSLCGNGLRAGNHKRVCDIVVPFFYAAIFLDQQACCLAVVNLRLLVCLSFPESVQNRPIKFNIFFFSFHTSQGTRLLFGIFPFRKDKFLTLPN